MQVFSGGNLAQVSDGPPREADAKTLSGINEVFVMCAQNETASTVGWSYAQVTVIQVCSSKFADSNSDADDFDDLKTTQLRCLHDNSLTFTLIWFYSKYRCI